MPRTIKAGDTFPPITGTLRTNAGPVDLTAAVAVRMWMKSASGTPIDTEPCEIVDAENGVVSYTPSPAETSIAGVYRLEWEVDWGDDVNERPQIQTFPNDGYDELRIIEALDPPDA